MSKTESRVRGGARPDPGQTDRAKGTIGRFIGLLANRTSKVATLKEIEAATATGWSGRERTPRHRGHAAP